MSIATATIDNPKKVIKPRLRLPRTAAEYLNFNPKNGFKYEWVKSKLLKSTMIKSPSSFSSSPLPSLYTEGSLSNQ